MNNLEESVPTVGQESRVRCIDLFAGAGGMTAGFKQTFGRQLEIVWANDSNQHAVDTYNANFGEHCVLGDLTQLLEAQTEIPEADLVIGGPPCQGFSLLNKKRDGDTRRQLWRPFLEVVKRSGARMFVMENVPGLLKSAEYDQIRTTAEVEMGFQVCAAKLCAADYGVPQLRWRAFIIGCCFADPATVFPPLKTHYNPAKPPQAGLLGLPVGYVPNPEPWRTVWAAIGDLPAVPLGTEIRTDLPPDQSYLALHFGRNPTDLSLRRYRAVPDEGMNRFDLQARAPELNIPCWNRKTSGGTDLFGRLWKGRPCSTIRTEFFKPEKGRYLHPTEHRPITHREAARLQSFPDDFRFAGTNKLEIAKQIGNAVPPELAAAVARSVQALFAAIPRLELLYAR